MTQPGTRSPVWTYGAATVVPILALTAQRYLNGIGGEPTPFLLAYPSVFLIVWFGGLGPGLVSTLLCGLGASYMFLPPYYSIAVPHFADVVKLGVFVVTGGLFSVLVPLSQKRLPALDQDFLTLLTRTSDFIYFKDKDSRIRFCSQAMAALCGYQDWREMIGKHDFEIFPEETAKIYYEEELPVFRDGKPLLNKVDPYLDTKGEKRWISTCKWPVVGEDGKTVVGIFGISRDITDGKRAEEESRRQSLRNEIFLRTASDGIHVLDSKGNVLEANDQFCQMLGYTHEEAMKLNVNQWDARWSDHELKEEILPRLLHRQHDVFETKHRRRDCQIIDVEIGAAVVEIDGERLLFAASRDITERKQAEEKLKRFAAEVAESNRLKDIFTDVLRHDILSPVSAISLCIGILQRKETDSGKLDLLQRVRVSLKHLEEMTVTAAKLALVTDGRALDCVVGEPVQLMRSMIQELEHKLTEKSITLTDHSGNGFSASFNPMLKDVFANLISNAIKYSPNGSRIDVAVENQGELWLFSVKDQGDGVPDKHKQGIFNRFERLHKEGVQGSGLGLTITKEIVSLHGGEIWLEDNPTGGSIFFVKVPKVPSGTPREGRAGRHPSSLAAPPAAPPLIDTRRRDAKHLGALALGRPLVPRE